MIADAFEEAERIVKSIENEDPPRLRPAGRARLIGVVAAAIEWQDAQSQRGLRSVEAAQRSRDADLRLHHSVADLRLHDRSEESWANRPPTT